MASILTCLFLIAAVQVFRTIAQCPVNSVTLTDATAKYWMSPNYPQYYDRNTNNCQLRVTARAGEVVHVSSVEMHLDGDTANCDDNVEFMNGDNTMIKKACGMDMITVQSSGQVLIIRFTSDDLRESRGFYLKYWSAPAYSDSCSATAIPVGSNPIFLNLPHLDGSNNAQNCEYKLMAPGSNDMVYVDLKEWDEPEALECGRGSIKVYDGQGTGGTMMVDACGPERPFWSVGSQGQYLTIKLDFTGQQPNTKRFYIRAMSMSKTPANCDDVSSMRIRPMSTFLWYPIFSAGGQLCQKTLLAPKTTARVTVHGKACNSNELPFTATDGAALSETCVYGKPTFTSSGQNLNLQPVAGRAPVLLEVASFESYCNPSSTPMEMMANNNTVEEIKLEDIQRNSHCMRRIKAPSTDDVVHMNLESSLESADCVYVYDGMDGSAQMIFTMCGEFEKKVGSTQQYLTFKVVTNGKITTGKLEAKYFSVKKNVACPMENNMLATRKKKELTTPNYPMEYPLDSMCQWRFVSYRPDYVVVVEVTESDLPEDCSDVAYVNDGETHDSVKLGEWCGIRKPTFRGTGQTLLVTFDADHMRMMGKKGFKFVYYADHKVAREIIGGTDVLTIAGVLTIIVVAGGIIFITYRLCSAKRAKRKALKEDRQPITQ